MKTLFTFIAFLLITVLHAQNFTFNPTETLIKTIVTDNMSDLNIDIIRSENVDTLYLEYELLMNTMPSEWYVGYCDNHGCWGSLPESGAMSPMYEDLNSFIRLSINPNFVEGSGTVEYYVYETGDYDNGMLMTFIVDTPDYVGLGKVSGLEFTFFPNPIRNKLIVKSEENLTQISVFDLTGKVIYQSKGLITHQYQIEARQWLSGIYLLEVVNSKNMKEIRKIIKR